MSYSISLTVNGTRYTNEVEPRLLLAQYLRDVLDLTGTHVGCDTTSCGACTVLLNGAAVKSCTLFAVQANGGQITTIEGLASDGELHPLQEGFWEEHGVVVKGLCQGLVLSDYVSLVVEGVYLSRFSSTSGAPVGS